MTNHPQTIDFNGLEIEVIEHQGQLWLTADQVGICLGYAEDSARIAVVNLYNRNADEFTEIDTFVIKLMTNPQGGNPSTRIFSPTGCNKLGFFANTARAKEFRTWASRVLAGQSVTLDVRPGFLGDDKLAQLLNGVEKLLIVIPSMMEVLTQMASAMPRMLEASAAGRQRRQVRRMTIADLDRITALRAKGYTLDELVTETDWSQSQVWCVLRGRYKVLESGRISIDCRSDAASTADAAAKAERLGPLPA